MPVSLDEMMSEVPPERRAEIERKASAMAADCRAHPNRTGSESRNLQTSVRVAVGTKATTGQRCPESGIWKVEHAAAVTAPITVHDVMPPYGNHTVTWVLVQHL